MIVVLLWRHVETLDGSGLGVVSDGTSLSQIDATFLEQAKFAQNPFLAGFPTTQSLPSAATPEAGWAGVPTFPCQHPWKSKKNMIL